MGWFGRGKKTEAQVGPTSTGGAVGDVAAAAAAAGTPPAIPPPPDKHTVSDLEKSGKYSVLDKSELLKLTKRFNEVRKEETGRMPGRRIRQMPEFVMNVYVAVFLSRMGSRRRLLEEEGGEEKKVRKFDRSSTDSTVGPSF